VTAAPRRRRQSRWRSMSGRIRRVARSRGTALLEAAGGVLRLFGWLYVAVLIPALLVVTSLVVRDALAGGDVIGSLHMFPLAMIWPLAALALRSDTALALRFPLNAIALLGSVALVITGWTVLIRFVRSLIRWRAAR
jgi:hypothetical protein